MAEMTADQAYATAMGHYNAGRFREAEVLLERVLAAVPDQPQALHMLAIVMHHLGRGTGGIEVMRHAIDLRPDDAGLRSNLGAMLAGSGDLDGGIVELRKAVALNPDLADGHNNLGNALKRQGNAEQAIAEYRKAIACRSDFAEAHNNLGASLQEKRRFDEALVELAQAIRIRADYPEAHNNMGNVLQDLGRPDEAIQSYRKAITARPNYAEAHYHLGVALRSLNRLGDAMTEFRTAMELRPTYAEALWAVGFLMLLQGDFHNGWRALEARLQLAYKPLLFDMAESAWDGSSLQGKTILVYGEQGLGDNIQFVRYVAMVRARGGNVVLACPSPLKRLFQTSFGIEQIATERDPVPLGDVRCAMLSLPRLFQTTLDTIPAQVPYLGVMPALAERWRQRLASVPGRLKVGLVWAGNRLHLNDRNRSVPLADFAAIARLPGVRLISLQKGSAATDIATAGIDITDWTTEVSDFADTAALVANLDLVISVDTAVAHLAGALAKPTWTLLPFAPDWRWMLNRPDSPWYPTMRLFRQPIPGDWATPLRQITQELTRLAEQGRVNR